MYLLILGIILVVMKYEAWGPVAGWSWPVVLIPFALAALWWFWADWSGYTRRKVMQRQSREIQKRRQDNVKALRQKPDR
jgi:small Trp-rich protein